MKTTHRLFAATVLTIVLTAPVLAGDMHTPSGNQQPPQPSNSGRVQSPAVEPSPDETDGTYGLLTEAALFFCQKILAVL